jgi:class 3 adenylate cyclase
MALPQPLPALRRAGPVAERDLPAPAAAPAATAAAPEAERRQLTVMFCDLVGSTALSTGMDPEDLRDVIASYQSRCSAVIRRYDGFVAKYMGDGILVYFGYPRAHEDEAERSVRAGLDIVKAMAELNAAVRRPPGVELAVRIGIATGPVIVGDQIGEGTASETAVVGETPNLAARLQALAQPNQIVVSSATRAMLGDHFDLEDLGASELKGFAEPVPAWRVLSARDVESRFAATRAGSATPLIGRQEEMGLLLRAWDGSRHGRGQVVLIQGEAGVGKSRLVKSLREAAGEDRIWVAIRCSPFHTASAFHPIIEHLKRLFGWQPEDTAQQRLAKLQGLAPYRKRAVVRRFDVRAGARGPLPALVHDGAAAARCDPRCDRCPADRTGRRHPGAHGMGGFALGRSDDVGNAGHADRADADGAAAGRCDLSAGIDAALAATLAHDSDHIEPPGAAGS